MAKKNHAIYENNLHFPPERLKTVHTDRKIQIYCCMYNLIPRASRLSDIGRWGLSIIGHLNINSICNKFEMLSMSVAQYVDMLILSETKLERT